MSESHIELRSALELMLECHWALQQEGQGGMFGAEVKKCSLLPEEPSKQTRVLEIGVQTAQ